MFPEPWAVLGPSSWEPRIKSGRAGTSGFRCFLCPFPKSGSPENEAEERRTESDKASNDGVSHRQAGRLNDGPGPVLGLR